MREIDLMKIITNLLRDLQKYGSHVLLRHWKPAERDEYCLVCVGGGRGRGEGEGYLLQLLTLSSLLRI